MKPPTHPARLLQLSVALGAMAFLAGTASQDADAQVAKIDGVRAHIHHATLDVKSGGRANTVALRLKAGDQNVVQVDVGDDASADFSFAREDIAAIDVKMGDGADAVRIDDANGAFTTTIPTVIAGGDGNDVLRGGQGNETFSGGDGEDLVIGGRGSDTGALGAGDDTFRWDPGEGSDVVEGQEGTDTMLFNGANVAEAVNITARDGRAIFSRAPGNVVMDNNGVEQLVYHALGGADTVAVGDLSSTDTRAVGIDLAGALGGTAADGAGDSVSVDGTEGNDTITVNGVAAGVDVSGLSTLVSVRHPDADDHLFVNTLGGSDSVFTSGINGALHVLVDGVAV